MHKRSLYSGEEIRPPKGTMKWIHPRRLNNVMAITTNKPFFDALKSASANTAAEIITEIMGFKPTRHVQVFEVPLQAESAIPWHGPGADDALEFYLCLMTSPIMRLMYEHRLKEARR